jgi:hypothetical protein
MWTAWCVPIWCVHRGAIGSTAVYVQTRPASRSVQVSRGEACPKPTPPGRSPLTSARSLTSSPRSHSSLTWSRAKRPLSSSGGSAIFDTNPLLVPLVSGGLAEIQARQALFQGTKPGKFHDRT